MSPLYLPHLPGKAEEIEVGDVKKTDLIPICGNLSILTGHREPPSRRPRSVLRKKEKPFGNEYPNVAAPPSVARSGEIENNEAALSGEGEEKVVTAVNPERSRLSG